MTQRRVRVRGIRRKEIDVDQMALVYWLMAKKAVEEKRQREATEKEGRARPQAMEQQHARG